MEDVGSFTWRIPSVTETELPSLCEGFLRPLSSVIIPKCITDLCINYYSLNDEIKLKDLTNIKPYSQIKGPIFKLFDCEFRLLIFRNRAYINFRLELVKLFGSMTKIDANATMKYFDGKNKKKTEETQLNWSWDKGTIQKWKNNILHQQFIKDIEKNYFELKCILKLNKLSIDHQSAVPEDKCADYLMLKRVTQNLSDTIMQRFDKLEKRLNCIENRIWSKNVVINGNYRVYNDMTIKGEKVVELRAWLSDTVGLGQYFHIFMDHGVEDLETVKLLTVDTLKSMEIKKIGHLLKMKKYIEMLKGVESVDERS